jgi:uncharacterized membrane protein
MKKRAPWIIAILVVTVIMHILTIKAYPYYTMIKLSLNSDRAPNTIYHAEPVSADSRRVVRPSPDLIYSICPFDVTEQPLIITAEVPKDTYWSVSMFAINTDNFFVINDQKLGSDWAKIILVKEGEKLTAKEDDTMVVKTSSEMGVVLFRMLITDDSKVDELIMIQKMAMCKSMRPMRIN